MLIAVIATCKVCPGTIKYEKPDFWEIGKLGMSVINDLVEETACFDNAFVESRDFSKERLGQEGVYVFKIKVSGKRLKMQDTSFFVLWLQDSCHKVKCHK